MRPGHVLLLLGTVAAETGDACVPTTPDDLSYEDCCAHAPERTVIYAPRPLLIHLLRACVFAQHRGAPTI